MNIIIITLIVWFKVWMCFVPIFAIGLWWDYSRGFRKGYLDKDPYNNTLTLLDGCAYSKGYDRGVEARRIANKDKQ